MFTARRRLTGGTGFFTARKLRFRRFRRGFDRMLEVKPPQGLVVGPEVVGGGVDFDRVCGESEAKVEVVRSPEKLPFCVKGYDQVVEIRSDSLAVKKTLVLVSRYMQQKMTLGVTGEDKRASAVLQPSMKREMGVSTTVDRVNEDVAAEVVFKLLCPYSVPGFVIGYKGKKVKALEEETKASIKFSAPDDNYNERVVVVSALEIDGAKVEVHDPSSGGDGQVIISGTPEQTLAAQSLLQAFINTAQ